MVVIAGVLVLVPTLAHGTFLGSYDILQSTGLNKVPNVKVHNSTLFDQISIFIPWTNLVWTQVHQGHLPLWNPYSALGMPLAFNWESAPLSLPVLIGYLFPVRLAYTVQVLVTIVVAGTGVYVLGKVLRLGTLGCMTAAIAFELSGAFMGEPRMAAGLGLVLGRLGLGGDDPGAARREEGAGDRLPRDRSRSPSMQAIPRIWPCSHSRSSSSPWRCSCSGHPRSEALVPSYGPPSTSGSAQLRARPLRRR